MIRGSGQEEYRPRTRPTPDGHARPPRGVHPETVTELRYPATECPGTCRRQPVAGGISPEDTADTRWSCPATERSAPRNGDGTALSCDRVPRDVPASTSGGRNVSGTPR